MANINSLFEVRKTGDHGMVARFPEEIEVSEDVDASFLVEAMIQMALRQESDVEGQTILPCAGDETCSLFHLGPKPLYWHTR